MMGFTQVGAPGVKEAGVVVEVTVTECNKSVILTADDGARGQRMQSGARDGVNGEESSKTGLCNNSVTVVAEGGARDQRMQSDVTEGARGGKGVGDKYDGKIRSGNDLNDTEKKYFVQRAPGICGVGQWQEPLVQGRGTGVGGGEKDGAAEGGAAIRGESKDGAEEEEETMMALRRAVLESMMPMREGDSERRRTFNKRQMDRLGAELELAKQLTAECGVELQLAVRALRETGATKAGAVAWIEKHRQRVTAELARQRKQRQ
jgi:hypothetical protein